MSDDGQDAATGSMTTRQLRDAAIEDLVAACQARFPEGDYEVGSDKAGTVWVKRADGSRSVGLQPWLLRANTIEDVLQRAESKLVSAR